MPKLLFWNLQKVNARSNPGKLANMQANCRNYFGAMGVPYPDVCAFSEVSVANWGTALPDLGSAIFQAAPPANVGSFYDFKYHAMDPNVLSQYSTEKATEYYGYIRAVPGALNSSAANDTAAIPAQQWNPEYTDPNTQVKESTYGVRKLSLYTFAADPAPNTQTKIYVYHPTPVNANHSFRTLVMAMRQANMHNQRVIVAGDFNIEPSTIVPQSNGLTAVQFAAANGFTAIVPGAAPQAGCGCGHGNGVVHTHKEGLIDWALHAGITVNAVQILPKIDPDSDHHPVMLDFS